MSADELLLQLRDITPPPEPPWYLLAPVEWVGLGLGIALLAALWQRRRRWRVRRRVAAATAELDRIRHRHAVRDDPDALARDLGGWLKRVALEAYPRAEVAALSGDRWLAFLDRVIGESSFSRGAGRVFGTPQYQPAPTIDAGATFALCERYLAALAPRLLSKATRC